MKSFLESQIMESRTVAIVGHTRPDGDCVGSCLATYNYIKEYFPHIKATLYLEPIPNILLLQKKQSVWIIISAIRVLRIITTLFRMQAQLPN